MKDLRLYHFQRMDFLRIGKLLADRDVFIVFFHLAKSPVSLNIAQLAGVFRREPTVISELLKELSAMGVARRNGGLYLVSKFGRKVMDFFEDITDRVELRATQPSAVPHLLSLSVNGVQAIDSTATNNSVVSTFAVTSWVTSENRNIDRARSSDIASYSRAEQFDNGQPAPQNAARSHNYL
jgi:hypothetical protein